MVKVIGGTGLVGSHLLCELSKSEVEIYSSYRTKSKIETVRKVFDYYFGEFSEEKWKKIKWVFVDLNDLGSLQDFIEFGDEVYHCAALVSFRKKDFNQLLKINRIGTTNVVNTALDYKISKLAYVSSTSAVSGGMDVAISEDTKWKKSDETSAYSISKYGAEREVWRGIEEGLSAVIVNPCVILGAGNWNESSLTILNQIERGLSFFPPGANAIVDARDVASCLVKLMKSETVSERFLLIGENISFKNLFAKIAKQLGKKPPKIPVGKNGLTMAKYMLRFWCFIRGKKSPITSDTVNSALSTSVYDNEKVITQIDHVFFSIDETIENAVRGKIR